MSGWGKLSSLSIDVCKQSLASHLSLIYHLLDTLMPEQKMVAILKWHFQIHFSSDKMMSSNGNIFRVTGLLCGEFTGRRWIPLTKASDAGLWCFLWSLPWINGWVNTREAGNLRCHHAHYDVIVMKKNNFWLKLHLNFSQVTSNYPNQC